MAGTISVRRLTRADVPWAIALTDTESWGYTKADFDRLLHLEPEGLFVAEAGGNRIGLTACTTWGPIAYVGAVIVDAAWRGKHVGDALLRACLDFLDGRGVESARLNAYLNVVPFYERLGFRREFENRRFSGRSDGRTAPGVRLAREDDLGPMSDLDRRHFGADRSRLLQRLLSEFPATSLVSDDGGDILGFAFGNAAGGGCEIGPFVCAPGRVRVAAALLDTMFLTADVPCALSVPSVNAAGIAMVGTAGMAEAFRTLRMYRGSSSFGGDPRGIFGLAGLEKG